MFHCVGSQKRLEPAWGQESRILWAMRIGSAQNRRESGAQVGVAERVGQLGFERRTLGSKSDALTRLSYRPRVLDRCRPCQQ